MGEIVFVRHLEREDDAGEGRAEDGGHACGGSADEHDAAVALVETEAPQRREASPEPGADGRATIDAGAFERGAAAEADGSDGGEELGGKEAHVDGALVLMVGADDLFGGVLVGVGREVLHDEAGERAAENQPWDDGPVMVQVVGENGRPHYPQEDDRDGCDGETGGNPDERRNDEPLVQIAAVGRGEVFLNLGPDFGLDLGKITAKQRVLREGSEEFILLHD